MSDTKHETALLIIDVQRDYFPGGRMELEGSEGAVERIAGLLDHFRKSWLPVIHVQHVSVRPGATFFLPGTPGMEFHETVRPLEGEAVVIKNRPNSFSGTELEPLLRELGVRRIVLAGMMTHMCVDSTVRAAFDLGFECIVAADCCATKTLKIFDREIPAADVQRSFLAALNGTFARVMKKEEICVIDEVFTGL
jgi:nicotinamidase-related amidase